MTWSDVARILIAEVPRALGAICRLLAAGAIAFGKAALASARALEACSQHIEDG